MSNLLGGAAGIGLIREVGTAMWDDAPVDTDFTLDGFAKVFDTELGQMIWRMGGRYASGATLQEFMLNAFQSIDVIVDRMIKWEMASMRAAEDLSNGGESLVVPFANERRDWLLCRIKKLVSGTESGLRAMIRMMVKEVNSGRVVGPIDPSVTNASIYQNGAMTVGRLTHLVNAKYDMGLSWTAPLFVSLVPRIGVFRHAGFDAVRVDSERNQSLTAGFVV